jgi:telomerase reverse transcriptase
MNDDEVETESKRSHLSLRTAESRVKADGDDRVTLSQATIPELLTFYQEPSQVSAFVCAVVRRLFPLSTWGSDHNFSVVTKYIDIFVKLRRRETLSTKNLLSGFKLNDVAWLRKKPTADGERQHLPPTDLYKRRQLIHDLLFWLYDSLIIALLRNNFYVTETSPHKSRVFYYRRPVWSRIHKLMMLSLVKQHRMLQPITQIEAEQMLRSRRLGYAHIRFLPKTNDLRPILNLKRRGANPFVKQGKHNSINSLLQDAFKVITHEKNTTAGYKFGCSVFSHDEEYRLLVAFKEKLKRRSVNDKLPRIYVVSLDIAKSYDTIKQKQLFEIVQHVFSKEEYLIQKYTTTELKGRGVVTKSRTRIHDGPFPQFFDFASELASKLKNVILTDNVLYTEPSTTELLVLLKQHIFENIVKDGQKYYLQTEGIPQGSILSSLLCSLYYGYIELNYLSDLPLGLRDDDNDETLGLLMRFVDDFLYLTTSLPHAIEFVTRLHRGFPEFGCIVNKNKTLVNFDIEEDGRPLRKCPVDYEGRMYVPWCGWCIDVETLEVQSDFSRYQSVYIGDSLTVEFGHKPGDYLRQKTMNYCEQKLHLILLDFNLNSKRTVYINIYNKMILCAIKFCRHVRELPRPLETNLHFLCDVVLDVVNYSFLLVQAKANSRLAQDMHCVCPVSQSLVTWLSLKAFQRVLRKKQSQFKILLNVIDQELKKIQTTILDDEQKFLNNIIQNKNSLCFDHVLY